MANAEIPVRIDTQQEAMKLRFEEYRAIYDNTTALSDRRQSINNLFVGINSLFLTAFGYLIITLRLEPWWPSIIFAGLTIPVTLINVIWYRLISRYKNLINTRIIYMRALEKYLITQGFTPIPIELPKGKKQGTEQVKTLTLMGIHHFEDDDTGDLRQRIGKVYGFSSLEAGIIVVFLGSYIAITALIFVQNAWLAFGWFGTSLPPIR